MFMYPIETKFLKNYTLKYMSLRIFFYLNWEYIFICSITIQTLRQHVFALFKFLVELSNILLDKWLFETFFNNHKLNNDRDKSYFSLQCSWKNDI